MEFFENNPIAIERGILSTYVFLDFYCDIMDPPTLPTLREELFSTQIHKKIASKFNKAIQEKESLGMVAFELQDKISGTRYEAEWLEILSSNPLPIKTLPSYFKLLTRIRIRNEYRR